VSNLDIVIIGAGKIAHEHLKAIDLVEGMSVSGVYSRTEKSLSEFAKKYNIKSFSDISDVIESAPDGMIIAVSADQVFQLSKTLLPFKIPLLIEKPPGFSISEIEILVQLAKENGTLNMVGLNRRHMSHFHKGIEKIKSCGPLMGVVIEGHERLWQLRNKVDKKVLDNWIFANSIHTIDLIRFFGGEVSHQLSFHHSFGKEYKDQLYSLFKMENNCLAAYVSNWHSPGSWSVRLMGNGISAVFSPLEEGYIIDKNFSKEEIPTSKFDKAIKPGFYNQMKAFQDLINIGSLKWPSVDLESSMKSYEIASKMTY
jgi:predicted dehydrogenase